jgi:membrane associated rhomboid family serine protease
VNEEDDEPFVQVGRFRNRREASDNALVLVAAGMDCQMESRGWGVALLVAESDAEAARRELAAYAEDNRADTATSPPRVPVADAATGVLAYWCVMVFIHAAAGRNAFGFDWYAAGADQAGLVAAGEWWRVITALGLHADVGHIASNLVAGGLFGFFVAEILGSGVGWLLILIAGIAGNAINSSLQQASHTSIGASTAIFGAVGLLAALAMRHRPASWRRGLRRFAPLAAGVMLLAFLGTEGERIDVGAHVAGFASGAALGAVLLVFGPPAVTRTRTVAAALAAVVVFGGAWLIALAHGGG